MVQQKEEIRKNKRWDWLLVSIVFIVAFVTGYFFVQNRLDATQVDSSVDVTETEVRQ